MPIDIGGGSSTANSAMADVTGGALNTNSAVGTIDTSKAKSVTASGIIVNSSNAVNTGCSVDLFNNNGENKNGLNAPSEFAIDQNTKVQMGLKHPSRDLSRKETTDIQR